VFNGKLGLYGVGVRGFVFLCNWVQSKDAFRYKLNMEKRNKGIVCFPPEVGAQGLLKTRKGRGSEGKRERGTGKREGPASIPQPEARTPFTHCHL
jgi:hypothetical protein